MQPGNLQAELESPWYVDHELFLYAISGAGVEPTRVVRVSSGLIEAGHRVDDVFVMSCSVTSGKQAIKFIMTDELPASER